MYLKVKRDWEKENLPHFQSSYPLNLWVDPGASWALSAKFSILISLRSASSALTGPIKPPPRSQFRPQVVFSLKMHKTLHFYLKIKKNLWEKGTVAFPDQPSAEETPPRLSTPHFDRGPRPLDPVFFGQVALWRDPALGMILFNCITILIHYKSIMTLATTHLVKKHKKCMHNNTNNP